MARIDNLTNFLTDVATAIKIKKETTEQIPAANFDSEILSIQTGGVGDVKLFETEEAMRADKNSQEDDLAIVYGNSIQNGTATTEFTQINFPDTVVLPSAITSSSSCSMRSDTGMEDGTIQLSATRFNFIFYGASAMVRVIYTSTNGITYTKTQGDNTVTFDNPIKCTNEARWNDNFGYFMQTGGYNFDGLFQYKAVTNDYLVNIKQCSVDGDTKAFLLPDINKLDSQLTELLTTKYIAMPIVTLVIDEYEETTFKGANCYKPTKYNVLVNMDTSDTTSICAGNNQYYLGIREYSSATPTNDIKLFIFNNDILETVSEFTGVSLMNSSNKITLFSNSSYNWCMITTPDIPSIANKYALSYWGTDNNLKLFTPKTPDYVYISDASFPWSSLPSSQAQNGLTSYNEYIPAPTQFTASINDLLPEKVAYSKDGVVIGDGSVYSNLDTDLINEKLLNRNNAVNLIKVNEHVNNNYAGGYEEYNILAGNNYFGIKDKAIIEVTDGISINQSTLTSGENIVNFTFIHYTDLEEDKLYVLDKNYDTESVILYIYKLSTGELLDTKTTVVGDTNSFISSDHIYLCRKQNGAIWFIGNYGRYLLVYKYDLLNNTFTRVASLEASKFGNYSADLTCFETDNTMYVSNYIGIYKVTNFSTVTRVTSHSTSASTGNYMLHGKMESRRYAVMSNNTTTLYLYNVKTGTEYSIDTGKTLDYTFYQTFDVGDNTYIILAEKQLAYVVDINGNISPFDINTSYIRQQLNVTQSINPAETIFDQSTNSVYMFQTYGIVGYCFDNNKTQNYRIYNPYAITSITDKYFNGIMFANQKLYEIVFRNVEVEPMLDSDFMFYVSNEPYNANVPNIFTRQSDIDRLFTKPVMTQTEYNTAIITANEILGEEE